MPWWGWLLAGSGLVGLLAAFLGFRKKKKPLDMEYELKRQEEGFLGQLHSHEKEAQDLGQARDNHDKKVQQIEQENRKARERIEQERKADLENLSIDPDALDRKLNDLLEDTDGSED